MGDSNAITSARTRFQLSESLKKDAKGAVKTAVEILGITASVTQNVPYLGIISRALAEFLKIEGEVTNLKSDWKAVMSVAQQIKMIIDGVHMRCEKLEVGDEALPEGFLEPLIELERCIAKSLEVLNACKTGSKSIRDRARVILNRADLFENVKQCRMDMQAVLGLFNTKLHIINAFAMQAHGKKLDEIFVRGSHIPQDSALNPAPTSLPPPPAVFHGRAREVDHIIDLILSKHPARIAILGSGGIGKTSIALTVLHHPEVEERYGEARIFMSCEAVTTADGVLQELIKIFTLALDSKSHITPRDLLLSHLHALPPGILCLDNLETSWDADASGVESLLADIGSLGHFALLVTTRGGERPRGVAWTQPSLPQIVPSTLEAALETWDAICGFHDDYSELLVKAVDLVPLAVTLLAQLALTESSNILWARWELEQTRMLRTAPGPEHRLNSVERSVVLSLTSPILRDEEGVLHFFSVLCTLPQGLPESRISAFVDAYAAPLPNMRRSIAMLKRCSLAYTSEDGFLRVLSPIRHYIETHYPCSDASLALLADLYCSLIESCPRAEELDMVFATVSIEPELINISAILELSLSRKIHGVHELLHGIMYFSQICDFLHAPKTDLVSRALVYAKQNAPELEASLLASLSNALRIQQQIDVALSKALDPSRMTDHQLEAEVQTTSIIPYASFPPTSPAIFHGRDRELRHVVDLIVRCPVRVAILGPGGMGKTCLALAALHSPEAVVVYGNHRFFVPCETILTAEALTGELLRTFGLISSNNSQSLDLLINHLSRYPNMLICLDSLETTWDADVEAVEALLYKLVSEINNLSLVITARGTLRPPTITWTEPFVPPLVPLTRDASLEVWDDIRASHDNYSLKLIEAVDYVPLAIVILAHLAETKTSEELWICWQREHTALLAIDGGRHSSTSVDVSIRLSLHGPRLRDNTDAMLLLNVICMLPHGLLMSRIPDFIEHFDDISDFSSSMLSLRHCALVFDATEDTYINVLAAVRAHVLAQYPFPQAQFYTLVDIYLPLLESSAHDLVTQMPMEVANISFILKHALAHEVHRLDRILSAVIDFAGRFRQELTSHDVSLLSESITRAHDHQMGSFEARLWQAKGRCLYHLEGCTSDTLSAFTAALELHRGLGNEVGISDSLLSLGEMYRQLNRLDDAEHMLQSALYIIRFMGDRTNEVYALQGIVSIYLELDRLDEAERELTSLLELHSVIDNPDQIRAYVIECLDKLQLRRRELDAEQATAAEIESSIRLSEDESESSDTQLGTSPSTSETSETLRNRHRRRRSDVFINDKPIGYPIDIPNRRLRSIDLVDLSVLGKIERVFPRVIPLAGTPEGDNPYVLLAVSTLNSFTCYRRLCEADMPILGEENVTGTAACRFEPIKADLLQHWMVIITVLAAITAIASAVFVAASGSILPITGMALLCIGVSASASVLGLVVSAMLLFQCWHINGKQFQKLALGIYEDYCFFAITATIPTLALLLAGFFVALFVLIVIWGVWPGAVIILVALFVILTYLQYAIKCIEMLITFVRGGMRVVWRHCVSIVQALRARMVSLFTVTVPPFMQSTA